MLKDDEVIGAIAIYRQEVRPFTDKQIELVTNFAAQAGPLQLSPRMPTSSQPTFMIECRSFSRDIITRAGSAKSLIRVI
jgi:hypothetical protein